MLRRSSIPCGIASLVLALFAAPAAATTDGICFRPINVPKGDTLNLRAAPSARARLVLALDPDSGVIAKTGKCQGGWCKVAVSTGDGTMRGFMNARYLRRSECP